MQLEDLIINVLLEEPEQIVSGETIARRLNVSRTGVWKNITALQKEGYEIEVLKGRGYKLNRLTHLPVEREVQRNLKTKKLGKKVFYINRAGSTNDVAKELARKGGEEGTLVIAGEQSKGRGRLGRNWTSPEGGLFMSLILRPNIPPVKLTSLTLISGLAVVKAIRSLYDLDVELKWPNDVMFQEKKLGGILTELEGEAEMVKFVVAGLGLNANCEVFLDIPTTSLRKELWAEVRITGLVQEILRHLEKLYEKFLEGFEGLLDEYKKYSQTLWKNVKIVQPKGSISGRAVDIDQDGALILRLADGSHERILSGDCQLMRP
jgi:BirA family biotin operon repressor/biotin-[acetyl-CoA-carboxylase] ligase